MRHKDAILMIIGLQRVEGGAFSQKKVSLWWLIGAIRDPYGLGRGITAIRFPGGLVYDFIQWEVYDHPWRVNNRGAD